MSNPATRFIWPVLLWCLCFAPSAAKEYWNYKTAYNAYDRGEFLLAADIYKRLAKKGDARAQNDLGFLYSVGQGVAQNFESAAMWFHKSAEQGHAPALLHLAGLYGCRKAPDARLPAPAASGSCRSTPRARPRALRMKTSQPSYRGYRS